MNVRPKTNSLGGTSSLGVIVFVTDNLEGSISCSLMVDAEVAWMLYALVHVASSLKGDCLNKAVCGRN